MVAVKNPRYSTLLDLPAKAGLRPGEAFRLQPGDIDWRQRTLRVDVIVSKPATRASRQ